MTRNDMLNDLKQFCIQKTSHLCLPTAIQKNDCEHEFRAPEVHKMRLPQSASYKKEAPYIIIQILNGMDRQPTGHYSESSVVVRFIFCVYSENEEEGAEMLLDLMDAVRIGLLKEVVIGDKYILDTDIGLESLVYTEDTQQYHGGEMIGTFTLPPIEREVSLHE